MTNCNLDFYLQTLVKQSSLDESLTMELDNNDQADDELREIEERRAMEESGEIPQPPSPRPTTPAPRKGSIHYKEQISTGKQKKYIDPFYLLALPWTPKVRQKDIDQFLDTTRMKFVGFMLPNDRVSLAGLPLPIHEGVRVLKQVRHV